MVFKCKMCDASLTVTEGESIAVCEYCGTAQTLPKFGDERVMNLYNRADHYRKNNEFDKAMALYEQILDENPTDAESYWSIILCKYGIEYVEEEGSDKRIPTVNRTQFTSVFDDENYKAALQYADEKQREIYEKEAATINGIQKGILEISAKEEPFDIFICYKETDERGRRTLDSVLATDLYENLTKEGYIVFFARVTLDDKFGEAYEPYIFAALQSSKVMIAVGTKPEHFEAIWVRNEWSRYLSLIRGGAKKHLIPAYKDMDPYDMPKEFAHLQAINLGELGFQQDLIRGIRKLISEEDKVQTSVGTATINVKGVTDRGFLFMEEKEWQRAQECMEKVLNENPRDAEAYLGKLMISLKVSRKEDLGKTDVLFGDDPNYLRVLRFGNEEQRTFVQNALNQVVLAQGEKEYQDILKIMNNTIDPNMLFDCATRLESLGDYGDAGEKAEECREKAKKAKERQMSDQYDYYLPFAESDEEEKWKRALTFYASNKDYKDSERLAEVCRTKLEKRAKEERELKESAVVVERSIERNKVISAKRDRIRERDLRNNIGTIIGFIIAAIVAMFMWLGNL